MRRASAITTILLSVIIAILAYIIYLQSAESKKLETQLQSLKAQSSKQKIETNSSVVKNRKNSTTKPVAVAQAKKNEKIITIELPKVPEVTVKVPKVVTVGGTKIKEENNTQLSMDMPQEEEQHVSTESNSTKESEKKIIGMEVNGRVPAYLESSYKSKQDLQSSLEKSGFKIIGKKEISATISTWVVTSEDLEKAAKNSPFIANIRLLIDSGSKKIEAQNPIYFGKAFAKASNQELFNIVLKNLNSVLGNPQPSREQLKSTLLPKYQFMFGMPAFDDMVTIKRAQSNEQLLSKLDKNRVVFKQKLDENRELIGLNLGKNTEEFIHIIGEKNALLLPYPVVLTNGKAKILNPKYYIAISYPMLKMSQFMKISDTPDKIENSFKELFQ